MNDQDNKVLESNNLAFKGFIGYGPTGVAFMASLGTNKKNCVVYKILTSKINRAMIDNVCIANPDLLPYVYKIVDSDEYSYIIMEYIPNSLRKVLSIQARLCANDQVRYASKIIKAIAQLHRMGIFHGNLKPQNILIDSYDQILLSGVTVNSTFNDYDAHAELRNQIVFMSPELIMAYEKGKKVDMFKADVWSFGVILYNITTGFLPLSVKTKAMYMKTIFAKSPNYTRVSDQKLAAVIKMCLQIDPSSRPSIEELAKINIFSQCNRELEKKAKQIATSSCPNVFVSLNSKIAQKMLNSLLLFQLTFAD